MSKVIDITNKLKFEEKPFVKVKDVEIEVNNDAVAMLEVTAVFEDTNEKNALRSSDIIKLFNLLFDEESRRRVKSLKLTMEDFAEFIMSTAKIALNNFEEEETEGEQPTPAMT